MTGLSRSPANVTTSSRPRARRTASSSPRIGPSPNTVRWKGPTPASRAQACSRSGKPFFSTSRPTETSRTTPSSSRGPPGTNCVKIYAVVDHPHLRHGIRIELCGKELHIRAAAGEHAGRRLGAGAEAGPRDLVEVTGVGGDAVGDPGEQVDEQGDERGVVGEVGVQVRDACAVRLEAGLARGELDGRLEALAQRWRSRSRSTALGGRVRTGPCRHTAVARERRRGRGPPAGRRRSRRTPAPSPASPAVGAPARLTAPSPRCPGRLRGARGRAPR